MTSPPVSARSLVVSAESSHCQPSENPVSKIRPVKRAVVVVPTYNEAANAPVLIEQLFTLPRQVDVVVVDDNSPDGTANQIRKHGQFGRRLFLLQNHERRGFAQACKDGFFWAVENGYDVCIEMDADLSHDPRSVPQLLDMIEEGADLAVGSRYLNGIRIINWPVSRLLLSLFAGRYTRFWTGLPMTDPTSGLKAIRTNVLRSIDWSRFSADGYGFIIELHFFAWQSGFAVRECPIIFTERRRGASKMSKKIMLESAIKVLKLACQRARRPAHVTLEPATSV
jgi:dolichol-phosphate mannosyltransferase